MGRYSKQIREHDKEIKYELALFHPISTAVNTIACKHQDFKHYF